MLSLTNRGLYTKQHLTAFSGGEQQEEEGKGGGGEGGGGGGGRGEGGGGGGGGGVFSPCLTGRVILYDIVDVRDVHSPRHDIRTDENSATIFCLYKKLTRYDSHNCDLDLPSGVSELVQHTAPLLLHLSMQCRNIHSFGENAVQGREQRACLQYA